MTDPFRRGFVAGILVAVVILIGVVAISAYVAGHPSEASICFPVVP